MHDTGGFDEVPGPVWDLASPAEIRRRGDSRARRRRVGAAVAGVAAVALAAGSVATGTVLARSGEVVASERFADASSGQDSTGSQRAAAGFDLTAGMRATTRTHDFSVGDEGALSLLTICGDAAWSGGGAAAASDVTVASGLDASGAEVRRSLLAYPDEGPARAALRSVRRAAASCTPAADGDERTIALGTGDEPGSWSWAYAFPSRAGLGPADDVGTLLAARVGTFLLVIRTADDQSSDALAEEQLSPDALRVLHGMCHLAENAC